MRLYWKEAKKGLRLYLADGAREEEVGGVRQTPRGFDAYARTFGYDPGRAKRDIATLEEAKAFVESFRPWELFVSDSLAVEPGVVTTEQPSS